MAGRTHFEMYQVSSTKQYRWRLRAANGEIVADSGEGYQDRKSALHGISVVKKTNGKTPIDEVSEPGPKFDRDGR